MNVFEIVVFASWLAAIWGIINASIQPDSAFESIGRKKWKWVVINVLGLIIPYLGLVTTGTYAFLVFRNLPTRSKKIRQGFNSTRSHNPEGYNRQSSSPSQETGFTVNVPKPAEQNRTPCSACSTSGRVNGDQVCYPCGGNGYI
jgi:hypothetical protein